MSIIMPRRFGLKLKLRIRRCRSRGELQLWSHLDNCLWPGSVSSLIFIKKYKIYPELLVLSWWLANMLTLCSNLSDRWQK